MIQLRRSCVPSSFFPLPGSVKCVRTHLVRLRRLDAVPSCRVPEAQEDQSTSSLLAADTRRLRASPIRRTRRSAQQEVLRLYSSKMPGPP
ncbi:hypothetical protein C8Q77DRAFT_1145824 [Trametes polyzona]|nr:hypothetical protein C8Q77DRAFT_1145824 [Trametes polyzona]